MMVKMPMPPSFHFGLGEPEFHYAFTLVDVIGSAYWTLGERVGRRLSASVGLTRSLVLLELVQELPFCFEPGCRSSPI